VIAVDANILVYAHRTDAPFHGPALNAVRTLAEGTERWAIPWPCIHEFLSVVTRARVFTPPSTTEEAIRQVDFWLESPSLSVIGESERHWEVLKNLAIKSRLQGPVFHDARVAAICLVHGVRTLWTADRDFSRFPALKTANPLIP
jgi:uncharacterized protein